jgi:hypothetical protein
MKDVLTVRVMQTFKHIKHYAYCGFAVRTWDCILRYRRTLGTPIFATGAINQAVQHPSNSLLDNTSKPGRRPTAFLRQPVRPSFVPLQKRPNLADGQVEHHHRIMMPAARIQKQKQQTKHSVHRMLLLCACTAQTFGRAVPMEKSPTASDFGQVR